MSAMRRAVARTSWVTSVSRDLPSSLRTRTRRERKSSSRVFAKRFPPVSGEEGSLLRAGYCAMTNVAAAAINPAELMRRAEAALQYAEVSGSADRTFSFDELPAT